MSATIIQFPLVPVPWIEHSELESLIDYRLTHQPHETRRQAELGIRKVLAEFPSGKRGDEWAAQA